MKISRAGRRSVGSVLVAVAAIAAGGCAMADLNTGSAVHAALPTFSPGHRWIRDDGIFELVRVDGDTYVYAAAAGAEIHLSRQLSLVKHQIGVGTAWEFQPARLLEWPLAVGKRGGASGQLRIPHATEGWIPAKYAWAVEAWEDVRTAAGPFRAFRVVVTITPERTVPRLAGTSFEYRSWYSPAARQFVKTESSLYGFPFQVVALDKPEEEPLQVIVHEPRDQTRLATDRTAVVGRVSGGGRVMSVAVSVNGERVSPDEKVSLRENVPLNLPVRLHEGKNVILVTAVDQKGNTRQEARTVFYDKPAPPPPVAARPPVATRPPAPPPAPPTPSRPTPAPAPAPAPARPAPAPPPAVARPPAPAPAPPAALPPLEIQIAAPGNHTKFDYETIGLAGFVKSGKGLRRVVVTLNGQQISRHDESGAGTVVLDVPVRLRDGHNTLVVTAVEMDGAPHQEVRTVFFEQPVPLAVDIYYPTTGIELTKPSTTLAGAVRSSKGLAKVEVVVNGVVVPGLETPAGAAGVRAGGPRALRRDMALEVPIELAEGSNVIVVRAEEPDGTKREILRTLTYKAPPFPVFQPTLAVAQSTSDRWAVIIGAGDYDARIGKLRYTINDAEALHRLLVGPAGFKRENVLLITDKEERKPTLKNIKWALGTFLARSARPEDTVLIFFAGHGAPEIDTTGAETDGFKKYLVPVDADADDLYSTGFPMDEVYTVFERIKARKVIMFVDACYSGDTGGETFGRTFASRKGTRATGMDSQFLDRATRSTGRVIITAAGTNELAMEIDDLRHGVFTYYLVRGLEGAADADGDSIVTLHELYQYLEKQVSDRARVERGKQSPVWNGKTEGSIPLVRVPRPGRSGATQQP